jgi:hypothetical protein
MTTSITGCFVSTNGWIRNARAHVGIKAQSLTHSNIQTLVASALRRRNRSFQENFCPAQRVPGFGRDARSISREINFFANLYRLNIKTRARFLQDMQRRSHNLRADAVAMRDRDRNIVRHDAKNAFPVVLSYPRELKGIEQYMSKLLAEQSQRKFHAKAQR